MNESVEKPNAASCGCERLDTAYPFECPVFRVRQDTVRWPGGHEAPFAYVETRGAVWIIPVTAEGQVVLIRQFRYAADEWCWEVPAGGMHDCSGTPLELAKSELREEVGGTSDDWTHVCQFRPGVSTTDEVCHVFLARDVRLDQEPGREAGEIIEVHVVPVQRALQMARNGEIIDGRSALALLRSEPFLRGQLDGGSGEA